MDRDYSDMFAILFAKSDLPSKDLSQDWHQIAVQDFRSSLTSGKFCLFHDSNSIDEKWNIIKEAVLTNKLGPAAKVSTLSGKRNHSTHVICVYTSDHTNSEDINRIREALRELGYIDPIPYKADIDTRNKTERFIFTI